MQRKPLAAAVSAIVSVTWLAACVEAAPAVKSVEFVGMPAPATADEKTEVYTKAQLRVTYKNGKSRAFDLQYHPLMLTGDKVGDKVVGGLYDAKDAPITDANGQLASDAPDGNSLMVVNGLKPTARRSNALALVTHYEYKELPPAGQTGSFGASYRRP